MTKITTIILSMTIVMAGVFALIPIEPATAVHTTIQGTQMTQAVLFATADLQTDITCDSDKAFIVYYIVEGPIADADSFSVVANAVTAIYTGDLFVSLDVGAVGYGANGAAGSIVAEADDTVVIDMVTANAVNGMGSAVSESGAVLTCT